MTSWELLAIGAILLLGVPHGGLDGAVARRIGWPPGLVSWLGFHLAYAILAALTAVLWWLFPLAGLGVFLLISALHFGGSDIASVGTNSLPWMAHGGLVPIAIPSLQPALVEPIFIILVGAENANLLLNGLISLFLPWLLILIGYCFYAHKHPQYRRSLFSLLGFVGLAIVLPPLASFALYFCFWHSRGHMLRLWQSLKLTERRRSGREAAAYTVISWLAAGLIFYYVQTPSTAALIKLTFIGLAALTLPHMLLVDYADRKHHLREELP
jgi:Brp/Blh family beta-carotene 15,15'-monooxygenase